jgi:hypothetical protein
VCKGEFENVGVYWIPEIMVHENEDSNHGSVEPKWLDLMTQLILSHRSAALYSKCFERSHFEMEKECTHIKEGKLDAIIQKDA